MFTRLYVDADDCPVKSEVYRLAQRYGLNVILVSSADIGAPFESWITKVVAGSGNVATIIANEAAPRDMVITDNPNLAADVRAKGATAMTVRGQHWTAEGPRPILPESKRGSNKARFEAVLDDELRARSKAGF
mgnify:FL=1